MIKYTVFRNDFRQWRICKNGVVICDFPNKMDAVRRAAMYVEDYPTEDVVIEIEVHDEAI